MSIVVPTILTPSRVDLEEKLKRLEGLVDTVQIDVVDGRFATPPTWPYANTADLAGLQSEGGWLREFGHFKYEIDLMTQTPEESAGFWIAAGATRIVVHIESTRALAKLIEKLSHNYGYEKGFAPDLLSFGLALNIDTDTRALEPYVDAVDYVQFMGIKTIGKQGQPFDRRVVGKLREFKKAHPDIKTQIDGGVTRESAPALLSAGVDRLVVGHALWEAKDIAAELSYYSRLCEEYGRYA
jgi:ribulose-phosphate 3-epimerase